MGLYPFLRLLFTSLRHCFQPPFSAMSAPFLYPYRTFNHVLLSFSIHIRPADLPQLPNVSFFWKTYSLTWLSALTVFLTPSSRRSPSRSVVHVRSCSSFSSVSSLHSTVKGEEERYRYDCLPPSSSHSSHPSTNPYPTRPGPSHPLPPSPSTNPYPTHLFPSPSYPVHPSLNSTTCSSKRKGLGSADNGEPHGETEWRRKVLERRREGRLAREARGEYGMT